MTDLNVIIAPEPFTPRVERMTMPALGQPVKVMLAGAIAQGKLDADDIKRVRVFINGAVLLDETPAQRLEVMRYVPAPGDMINIVVSPLGGGGSGSGENKALQTVLTIAVIAVSFIPGIGPIAAAAIRIGGMMAISKIFAPKAPQTLADGNNRQALQRATNNYRPRDPMPLVLGKQRIGFDLAAPPYTQLIGEDAWLNIAFVLHYGPCTLAETKIGETLLADYPAEDYQVEYFLTPGVPRRSYLYPDRVVQESLQDELTKGGAYEVHTTATSTERVGVDVTLPNGLRYNKDNGKILNQEVQGEIQYSVVGANAWVNAPIPAAYNRLGALLPAGQFYIQGRTNDALRRSFEFNLPAKGQYDVRVRVWDPDNDDPTIVTDKTYWTGLRSIERKDPIVDTVVSVMFLRVRSTDDLNGSLPVVTGVVEPIVPVFLDGAWTGDPAVYSAAWQPSSNAAALLRYVLAGYPAAKPLLPDEFHSSAGLTYNLIEANPSWKGGLLVTDKKTQQDVMVALGKMGRFSVYWNGSRLCFVPDWYRDAPRQAFTGRNANNYRYRRIFPETIHAVFVEFSNTDEDSAPDELWVYADGYDGSNATLFESLKIEFACTAERAFQEGRVYLAKRLLQVEVHEWNSGPDAIGTTYGDRVLVSHEAALFGLARVRAAYRRMTGALVAGVRLDEWVEMEAGKTYGIDLRRADQLIRGIAVQTVPGRTRDLVFAAPRAADIAPRKGDLLIFGETGLISEDVEIIDVEPQSDLTVTFRAVPYMADAIAGAINDPIPTIISAVRPREPAPRPLIVIPDSATPEGVVLAVSAGPWKGTPIAGFTGRWRQVYDDAIEGLTVGDWIPLEAQPLSAGIVKTGPITGAAHAPASGQDVTVDVEVRTVLVNGETSQPRAASNIPILADIPAPTGFDAVGASRVGADGSGHGVLAVTANAVVSGDIQDLEVEVMPHAGGAWVAAVGSPLPARNPVGDLTGLGGGTAYDVRGRWRRSDNWCSPWALVANRTVPAGSNVASDVIAIGDRPTGDVLADIDLNALNIASEMLRSGTWRGETDEILFIDGVPVRTVTIQLGVTTADHQVFITDLRSVDGAGVGKAVFAINVDGHIIGRVDLNDGTTGSTYFVDDFFGIVGTDPENPKKVFVVDTIAGKVKFTADVAIDGSLTINGTIITPGLAPNSISDNTTSVRSATTYGTGYEISLFTQTFVVDYDARVRAEAKINFGDGGGNGPSYHSSHLRLIIDGVEVDRTDRGGTNATMDLGVGGFLDVLAGTITVELRGWTKPDDFYDYGNMFTEWFKR